MQTKQGLISWKLLLQWIIVNTICIIVSVPIVGLALLTFGSSLNISNEMENSVFPILFVSIMGILLGIFQWLILRSQIAQARWWILISGIGLAVGVAAIVGTDTWVSTWKLTEINSYLWTGAVLGTTLGIAQWLFLRQHIKYSILWILGSTFGSTLGWVWGQTAVSNSAVDSPIGAAFIAIAIFSRLMITYSVFTGVLLVWLINYPLNKPETAA